MIENQPNLQQLHTHQQLLLLQTQQLINSHNIQHNSNNNNSNLNTQNFSIINHNNNMGIGQSSYDSSSVGGSGFTQVKIKKKQTQQQIQQIYLDIFKMFSSDGLSIKATEFVGLGKLLKVHPVIITFDQFKKVLLRSPEYWNTKKDLKHLQTEVISATFSPSDFLRAFKIIARIGYKTIEETNQNKFILLTQYLKKQLSQIQMKREKAYNDHQSDTRSVKTTSIYDATQQFSNALSNQNSLQLNSYQNRIATSPGNAYYEMNQAYTPSQASTQLEQTNLLDNKRLSGSDLQATTFSNQTLSNDYRGYHHQPQHTTIMAVGSNNNRLNSSSHGLASSSASQWRTCNSEIKSDISSRAFSTAVRSSQGKTKALIIPKGLLKKKFKQQPYMSVNNYLQYKSTNKSITGKSQQNNQNGIDNNNIRKSYNVQQYKIQLVNDTRNKSPSILQSLQENQRYNNIHDTSNETITLSNQQQKHSQNLNNILQHHQINHSANLSNISKNSNPISNNNQHQHQYQTLELSTDNIKLLEDHNKVSNTVSRTQQQSKLKDNNNQQNHLDQINPMQTIDHNGSESQRSLNNTQQQQQSFRIRKFSRSISRQSRTGSQHSFRSVDENNINDDGDLDLPEDAGVDSKRIISGQILKKSDNNNDMKHDPMRKSIDFNDIKLANNGTGNDIGLTKLRTKPSDNNNNSGSNNNNMVSVKEYKRLEKHMLRYKNERDSLVKVVQQMKTTFLKFVHNQQQIDNGGGISLKNNNNTTVNDKDHQFETGNSVHKDNISKDERIKQLEEELRKLKSVQ